MPKPTLPMDILTGLAGMGRGLVNRLPDDVRFPPIAPLEPFYGAGKAPRPSVRDIGEFLVPQSALDVGLMAVPGGKVGKKVGGKLLDETVGSLEDARNFLRKLPYTTQRTEASLVPAIRSLGKDGQEYVGRLGKDIYHSDIIEDYGLTKSRGWRIDATEGKYERGFVDKLTGKWITRAEASGLQLQRAVQRGETLPIRLTGEKP